MGGIVANIRSATNDDQRIDPELIKSEKWICEECTFANNAQYLMVCSCCGTPKGGKAPSADAGWTCAVCTLINSEDRDRCAACSKSRNGAFWFAPDDVKRDSAPSARSAPSATSGSSSQPRKSSNAARAAPPANTKASPKKSRMNGGSDGHVLHYLDRRQSMLTGDVTWEVELSTALEKYRSFISFCRANREQFTDPDFPPADCSLRNPARQNEHARHVYDGPVQWLRPWQMDSAIRKMWPLRSTDKWTLMSNAEPGDIRQGALGDCWLLSAIAVVSERRDLLERIFMKDVQLLESPSEKGKRSQARIEQKYSPEGVYMLRLCVNGQWKAVLVDDLFPCDMAGRMLFSKSKRHQLWVPLIEKALAKLHGSYGALAAGRCVEALCTLTGYPCETINLETGGTSEDRDLVWARLLSCRERGYLMGASCGAGKQTVDEKAFENVGLWTRHAYSVLDVQEVPSESAELHRLLRLRNPWGNERRDWRGAWSANSTDWKQVPEAIVSKLLAAAKQSDSFWIAYSDLLRYFDAVDCCMVAQWFESRLDVPLPTPTSRTLQIAVLTVFESTCIELGVFQASLRGATASSSTKDICVGVYRGNTFSTGCIGECVSASNRNLSPFVSCDSLVLPPGEYTLVVTSFVSWSSDSDRADHATVVIHSEKRVLVEEQQVQRNLLADAVYELVVRFGMLVTAGLPGCVVYELSGSRWAGVISVALNGSNDAFHVALDLRESINLVSSRQSLLVYDVVPAHCRQVLLVATQLESSSGMRMRRHLKTSLSRRERVLRSEWRLTSVDKSQLGAVERLLHDPEHDPAVLNGPVEHLHAPRPI